MKNECAGLLSLLLSAALCLTTVGFRATALGFGAGTVPLLLHQRLPPLLASLYDGLDRKALQALAKERGIKANLASAAIIEQLSLLSLAPAAATAAAAVVVATPAPAKKNAPAAAPAKAAPVKVAKAAPTKPRTTATATATATGDKLLWVSNEYSSEEIEEWWRGLSGPLLTVGSKGVTAAHVRSLENLLQSHKRVRVKLASDKLDVEGMAHSFVEQLQSSQAELLVVKRKEFMVGGSAPEETKKSKKDAESPNKGDVCLACGEIGHHRVQCPNKRRPDYKAVGIHPNAEKILKAQAETAAKKKVSRPGVAKA